MANGAFPLYRLRKAVVVITPLKRCFWWIIVSVLKKITHEFVTILMQVFPACLKPKHRRDTVINPPIYT